MDTMKRKSIGLRLPLTIEGNRRVSESNMEVCQNLTTDNNINNAGKALSQTRIIVNGGG